MGDEDDDNEEKVRLKRSMREAMWKERELGKRYDGTRRAELRRIFLAQRDKKILWSEKWRSDFLCCTPRTLNAFTCDE